MLRLSLTEQSESLRKDLQIWLKKNPPPSASTDTSLETFVKHGRKWQQQLASGRWIGVHWPQEYGGRSLSLVEEAVIQEELVRVQAPQILGLFGLTMVGPVLIEHGTIDQKQKFLSKILSGEDIWCQGFSEPNAGSDLAAIATRAEIKEGKIVISGQKVWTSFAHIADYCFLLCRTDSSGKKHEGLTYVLVDMKQEGITTRPLKQISGDDEFNEVFFDQVVAPVENIIGGVGEGWKIALSTLMYERVILTFSRQLQSETALRALIERYNKGEGSTFQNSLAKEIATACAVRALACDHLLSYSRGQKTGPEGSLDKLFWSESFQQIAKLGLQFDGIEAAGSEAESKGAQSVHRYLYSRGRTLAAGTSEIQRNIIAERVLGLPRAGKKNK